MLEDSFLPGYFTLVQETCTGKDTNKIAHSGLVLLVFYVKLQTRVLASKFSVAGTPDLL